MIFMDTPRFLARKAQRKDAELQNPNFTQQNKSQIPTPKLQFYISNLSSWDLDY